MRRMMALTLIACVTLASTGCVVALGNRGSVHAPACRRQAVAVDGRIYVVDVKTGKVAQMDPQTVANAELFKCGEADEVKIKVDTD